MRYSIAAPKAFLRRAGKFLKKHPDLKEQFAKVVDDLSRDPFQSHLALHPLSGKLEGLFSVSLTHSYRLVLTIMIEEKEIVLIDIGSHDQMNG